MKSNLIEMNNVGIVVEDMNKSIAFFEEIGLKVEGRMMVTSPWAGKVTGLENQSVEITMMITPDGNSRIELSQFLTPEIISDHRTAPVNSLGYLRIMFRVDNLEELIDRLMKHNITLEGEIVNFENLYKLCYIRSEDGLLIGLAQQLSDNTTPDSLKK